jgi:hypothetical protein
VLPAVTPDSATDFFGLNAPVFGVLLSASLISCLQKAWWGFLTGILKRKERASRDIAC